MYIRGLLWQPHNHASVGALRSQIPTLRKSYASNSHGARPVHLIITMIKWIQTSKLAITLSLSLRFRLFVRTKSWTGPPRARGEDGRRRENKFLLSEGFPEIGSCLMSTQITSSPVFARPRRAHPERRPHTPRRCRALGRRRPPAFAVCGLGLRGYRGTSLIRNSASLGPYFRTMPRALGWS